jgi:tetratricopeptide (TPR) repeat protein
VAVAPALYEPEASGQAIEFWRKRAQDDPEGAISRRELGAALLARGREKGDIADAVRAEAAARQSLEILPHSNAAALNLLGRSLLTQHRFPEAMAVADRAVALDLQAHRLRADVLLETGRYEEAERAYRLARAATDRSEVEDDLNLMTLRARVLESKGQGDGALALMQKARGRVATLPDMPAETAACTTSWSDIR